MTVDPRVTRTRIHVLQHARELLAAEGAAGLTYTALSARSAVARPTLYRHWPTTTDLLVDLICNAGPPRYPARSADVPLTVRVFLTGLRDSMLNPALAAAFSALVGAAEHDEHAHDALVQLTADRLELLNTFLAPSDIEVDPVEFAQLSGAVLFQRFIVRADVTDDFSDAITTRWWRLRSES
jgi:AcrR family transcriptional regulator